MKHSVLAIIAATMIAGSSHALAQSASAPSNDVILKRLDALEKENRTLRDRVQLLEAGKRRNTAAAAPQAAPSLGGSSTMAMATNASGGAVYKSNPPPVLADNWSGVYVGLEGGYGWGKQNADGVDPGDQFDAVFTGPTGSGLTAPAVPPLFFPDLAIPSIKQKGWLYGGFFGAQKQWGNWVLGIEGDIDGADIKGSGTSTASSVVLTSIAFNFPGAGLIPVLCGPGSSCVTLNQNLSLDSKIDALASLRGKVGWSFAPDWLIYGTGGAAFAHTDNTVTTTASAAVSPSISATVIGAGGSTFTFTNGNTPTRNASGGATMFGWALGGGVDWKLPLDAGSALVFGVEYLHYGFPEQTITLSNNAGGSLAFNAKEHVDTVKGRASYLFSIH